MGGGIYDGTYPTSDRFMQAALGEAEALVNVGQFRALVRDRNQQVRRVDELEKTLGGLMSAVRDYVSTDATSPDFLIAATSLRQHLIAADEALERGRER